MDNKENVQGAPIERVGVLLVHGIGEQKRFEHLDAQVREIVRALTARSHEGRPSQVSVEINGSSFSTFAATQDTWASGDEATVRALVRDAETDKLVEINFCEVWWADVNEPFSLSKQLRFWLWGLIIAFIPMKHHSTHASARSSRDPIAPGGSTLGQIRWVRLRLFGVSFVAVLGAMSVGLLTFLAKRILKLEPPDIIKVFVNYVAGVKLYNQRGRFGLGFPSKPMDFLDSLNEPPRVSVRRRMIRVIAQAARANYDRWYIVSHSLGTVVAFNGLMESAYAWPGYFDQEAWQKLVAAGLAGEARSDWAPPVGSMSPVRPVWCGDREIAYRSRIFSRLHGVLMMGTPLEKFATLWPGRVPISSEPAFREGTTWLSLYDPLDPVSGILRAFNEDDPRCSPSPETIGYAADWRLLISHIRYLTWRPGGGTLADGLAHWLVTGSRSQIRNDLGHRWFAPYRGPIWRLERHIRRSIGAWIWWFLAVALLTALGTFSMPVLVSPISKAAAAVWKTIESPFLRAFWQKISDAVEPARALIFPHFDSVPNFLKEAGKLWVIAIAVPLVAGLLSKRQVLRGDSDDSTKLHITAIERGDLATPEPSPD